MLVMAVQKPTISKIPDRPELDRLLELARSRILTDAELHEQRVSFAYGNASDSELITKESIRAASRSLRIDKG